MRRKSAQLIILLLLASGVATQGQEAEFKKVAGRIVAQRQAGGEEDRSALERALTLLDEFAMSALNMGPSTSAPGKPPALKEVTEKLKRLLATEPHIGENYVAMQVGAESAQGGTPVYAVVVNFSLSGPSAVRLYEPRGVETVGGQQRWTGFRLAGQIDRFTAADYFDEYLEVVALNPAAGVFVTVTGRTDEHKTGAFVAWRYARNKLELLWSSDLLERSSYEAKDGVLRIDFCSEPDEDKPSICRKMLRERYAWSGGWTRIAQEDITPKTMNE